MEDRHLVGVTLLTLALAGCSESREGVCGGPDTTDTVTSIGDTTLHDTAAQPGDTRPDTQPVCGELDSDQDGVPDGCDVCPGYDDKADANGNRVPDGCEPTEPPYRPFPQGYVWAGAIRPDRARDALNQDVIKAYEDWKAAYLRPSNGTTPSGYYIEMWGPVDGSGRKTTSEATGFGMIVFALMAGHDPDAQKLFDGLLAMALDHPSVNDPDLMSWVITGDEQAYGDQAAATDGDLDIAYALLLADAQWGSDGGVDYKGTAHHIINEGIIPSEIASGYRTLLGDWDEDGNSTRPSDWALGHFTAFVESTEDPLWDKVHAEALDNIQTLQSTHSPSTGLMPDFVVEDPPRPAPPWFLEKATDGDFSWNACRVPWRLTVDWVHNQTPAVLANLKQVSAWIDGATQGNPGAVKAGYTLSGTPLENYSSMAFTAPLVAASIVDPTHQRFLDAGWELMRVTREGYYPDSINLLSMLVISGNWWRP